MNPTTPPATQSPTDLASMRQNAYDATTQASQLQANAPSMLNDLRQNLMGIFSKDNPIMSARNSALTDYLSTPSASRAGMLPDNMPQVAGRALTLSPTQQDAITTHQSAAALAPLAGYNEILKGMFGNIGDVVNNAGNIYKAKIDAANSSASNLLDSYKQAFAEHQAQQQYDLELKKLSQQWALNQGVDLPSLLSGIMGNQNGAPQQNDPNAVAASIYGTGGSARPAAGPSMPSYDFSGLLSGIKGVANNTGKAISSGESNVTHWLDSLYSHVPTAAPDTNNPIIQFLRKYNL